MVQEFKPKYRYTNTNTQQRQRCKMCQCWNTNTNTQSVFKCVCQRSKCLKQRRWDFNVALTSPAAAWTQLSHLPQNSHPRSSTLTIRDGKRQQLEIMINSTVGLLVFKWIFHQSLLTIFWIFDNKFRFPLVSIYTADPVWILVVATVEEVTKLDWVKRRIIQACNFIVARVWS